MFEPLAAICFTLHKGPGVSWEFHPYPQKVENEYFTLSLKKMATRPSALLREGVFGHPLGRGKVDTGIFRHWFSVVVWEPKEILKAAPQPRIPI